MFEALIVLGAVLLLLSLLAHALGFLLWVGIALMLCGAAVILTGHHTGHR